MAKHSPLFATLLMGLLCAASASGARPTPTKATKALFSCGGASSPVRVGGPACQKPTDPRAQRVAAVAVQQLNAANALSGSPVTLVSVEQYATQVVAGLNHFVQLKVKNSKGATDTVQVQVFDPLPVTGSGTRVVSYAVLPQQAPAPTSAAKPAPAPKSTPAKAPAKQASGSVQSMEAFTCRQQGIPGGLQCKDASGADAKQSAETAVKLLNEANVVPNGPVVLVSVTKYATQVVAGTNIYLELKVKDSKGAERAVQARVFQPLPVYGTKAELSGFLLL